MKHFYLKSLFLSILSLISITTSAEQVDGIFYNLDMIGKTAIVVSGSPKYSGAISIPPTITCDGTSYSVTSIGAGAFKECYDLTSVIIPSSVTSIYYQAFDGCNNLSSVIIEDGAENLSFVHYYERRLSKSYYISDYFSNCPIERLYLGRNINYTINSDLKPPFAGNSSLTSVSLGNNVTRIEESAFCNCSGLTSIIIPNSVMIIGVTAFAECHGLTSIIIEDGLETLLFNYSRNDERVSEHFRQCPIENIYLGRNISYLHNENSPFMNISTLKTLTIGNNVTSIEKNAFYNCSSLGAVTIGNGVTSIGNNAFFGCTGLTNVSISDIDAWCNISLYHAFSNPLYYAHNLYLNNELITNLVIPNGITKIDNYAFINCASITSIDIPNRVTSIGNSAFSGCNSLYSINIPNRVTSIGEYAFYNCGSLTSLSIPISVTSIGNGAFYGCTNLESVYSEITDVFSIDAFDKICDAVLYVPYGKKLTYIQTSGWNVFNDIIEMDPALMNTSLLLSCNSKGSITINGTNVFTNKIGSVDILKDAENTIVFTPKANCKLEQVCFNGFDVTTSVENNTLKAIIPAKSQMVVTFANESGDMNNDGKIDISDVVVLVNMILGQ